MQAQAPPFDDDAGLGAFWRRQQRLLSTLLDHLVPPGSRTVFLDYPVSTNVGDLLLYHGTEAWLTATGQRVLTRASIRNFRFQRLPGDVIILCQGGGNFGDLYPHQAFRESVVRRYPHNRIVFLPQTIHYRSAENLARSSSLLCTHPDLHLILRDSHSLQLARRHFPACSSYLAPDMAVMLYPFPMKSPPRKALGRLCLFRRDIERPEHELPPCGPCNWRGDWRQLLGVYYVALRMLQAVFLLTNRYAPTARTAALWRAMTRLAIGHSALMIRAADSVETSRLHGHIFASLLGVPNRLHENSYGKNTAYFESWHADMPLPMLQIARQRSGSGND
jgi:pyruvyl transferase EpsO